MILSTLGRKVLEETKIPKDDIDWYWWIERRLQVVRINGLVKMVNESKEMDRTYIDGYWPKYKKWASRPSKERVIITQYRWIFDLLQLMTVDFPWNLWKELVKIPLMNATMFGEALYKMQMVGKNSLNYALAIYRGMLREIEDRQTESFRQMEESQERIEFCSKVKVGSKKKQEWQDLRENI